MTTAEIVLEAKHLCSGCRREIPHKLLGGKLRHLNLDYPPGSSVIFDCEAAEILLPLIKTTGKYQNPVWPDDFEAVFYSK